MVRAIPPQELLRPEHMGTRAFPSFTSTELRATVTEFGLHLPGAREGGTIRARLAGRPLFPIPVFHIECLRDR